MDEGGDTDVVGGEGGAAIGVYFSILFLYCYFIHFVFFCRWSASMLWWSAM